MLEITGLFKEEIKKALAEVKTLEGAKSALEKLPGIEIFVEPNTLEVLGYGDPVMPNEEICGEICGGFHMIPLAKVVEN